MSQRADDYLERFPVMHTTDLDLSRSVMGNHYCRHEVDVKGRAAFESHVNSAHVGNARITYVDCGSPLLIRTTSSPLVHTIFMPEEGGCDFSANGERSSSHAGQGVFVGAATELTMDASPIRLLSVEFPSELIAESMASRGIDRLSNEIDLNSGAGALLRSLCRWTAQELDRSESTLSTSVADHHLSMTLLTMFMECLAPSRPGRGEMSLGRMAFRDLEAFVDNNLTQPLTLEVLARMTGASPRTIQLAFRKFRNCTPTEFIRQRRLEAIHAILSSSSLLSTITELAFTYGFFHQGRFSRTYFRRFGELPHETHRRSKSGASDHPFRIQ
jgi:AraC-like DNA-binding protein